MKRTKDEIFESAPVSSAVLYHTIPAICSMIMVMIYNLADTFFVGQTGDPYMVAAVSYAMPIFMIPSAIGNLFGIGGTSVISRAIGRGDKNYAKKTSSFCFWTGTAAGLLCMILMLSFASPLSRLLGATSSETFSYTRDYLANVSMSAVFIVIANAFSNILRAEGQSLHAMAGMLIGNFANIILDPIFIFTLDMGITGAAIATALGNIIGALYYIIYFFTKKSELSIHPADYRVGNRIAGSVLSIGIPAALTSILMSVSQIVVNGMMSAYGDLVVAGYGVNLKIHMIISYVVIGLGQGIQPLLGYCYGAGLKERYRKIMRFSIIYSLIVSTALTLVCVLCAKPLVGLFLENRDAFDYGVHFTIISLLSGPVCGVLYVLLNALQARGAATASFLVSVSRQGFIYFPLLFLLHHLIGRDGLVWTQQFSDILSFILAIVLYIIVSKKTKEEVKQHAEN